MVLYSTKSIWWRVQKATAVSSCILFGLWLFFFIRAATTNVTLSGLTVAKSDVKIDVLDAPLGLATSSTDSMPSISTFRIDLNDLININAFIEPDVSSLPAHTRNRISCIVLRQNSDMVWRKHQIAASQEHAEFNISFDTPGNYIFILAVPPATVAELENRDSSYIANFLASGISNRVKGIQIVVGAATKKQPEVAAQKPAVEVEHAHEPEIAQYEDQLTTEQAETLESEPKHHADAAEAVEERDLTMRHDGEENGIIERAKEQGDPSEKEKQLLHHTYQIPRRKDQDVRIEHVRALRTEGALPPIEILYSPQELRALTSREWFSIAALHQMPFVAVPERREDMPLWPLLLHDGRRIDKSPEEIRKAYGISMLPLSEFSNEVQSAIQKRFDDPVTWFKCTAYRGFLLSDILLEAIREAFAEEEMTSDDIDNIKLITVSIEIEDAEHPPYKRLKLQLRSLEKHR